MDNEEQKGKDTETRIMEAAKTIFIKKGMDGSRMQEIANEAGINKSLLHYYYRSKEKLFNAVFKFAFIKFMPDVTELLENDLPVFKKIEFFAEKYIDMLSKNSFIPLFILQELTKNPGRIVELIEELGISPQLFIKEINREINMGIIKPIDPEQILVNLLSLCIFPIVARPLMQKMLFNDDSKLYDQFIEQRKKEVPQFIINSIKA